MSDRVRMHFDWRCATAGFLSLDFLKPIKISRHEEVNEFVKIAVSCVKLVQKVSLKRSGKGKDRDAGPFSDVGRIRVYKRIMRDDG